VEAKGGLHRRDAFVEAEQGLDVAASQDQGFRRGATSRVGGDHRFLLK
jgi:hypothetical protein